MKKLIVSAVVLLMAVAITTQASAGVLASAFKGVTGARVEVFDTGLGDWRFAIDGFDFVVLGSGETSSSLATLNGAGPLFNFSPTIDVASSYWDSTTGPSTGGATGGPVENSAYGAGLAGTVPVGAVTHYAHSDIASDGSGGDLVTAPGAGVLMTASTELGLGVNVSAAITNGNLNAQVNTTIQALADAAYRIAGSYDLTLVTDITAPGGTATAASAWSLTVNGSTIDGQVVNFSDTPSELNAIVSGGADLITSGTFATDSVNLLEFGTYTIGIDSTVNVRATSGEVPEPTSMVIFAGLGLCGLAGRRRKSVS